MSIHKITTSVTNAPVEKPASPKAAASSAETTEKAPTIKPRAADRVSVSTAAMAALLQEAKETPARTAAAARRGDRQAQHLMAQQAAAKAAEE